MPLVMLTTYIPSLLPFSGAKIPPQYSKKVSRTYSAQSPVTRSAEKKHRQTEHSYKKLTKEPYWAVEFPLQNSNADVYVPLPLYINQSEDRMSHYYVHR